ncbi:hypothetical protein BDZ45DRAFT_752371 [Acephala macrosclerotiorum]|nr:hypothetical protein BDZ45DRAFT_752371 [Acephala macrosclerotiorum]
MSGSSPPIKFPRFRDLPTELRYAVWRMAMPRRVVHIYERPVINLQEQEARKRQRRLESLGVKTLSESNDWAWKRPWDGHSNCGRPVNYEEEEYLVHDRAGTEETFFCKACNAHLPKAPPSRPLGIDSDSQTPSLILACQESFQACRYVRSFVHKEKGTIAQTYFNPEVDTLFFSEKSASLRESTRSPNSVFGRLERFITKLSSAGQIESVRYVGLTIAGTSSWAWLEKWLAKIIACFANVRTLYLVIDDWPVSADNGKPWLSTHRRGIALAAPINPTKVLELFNSPDPKLADWYHLRSRIPTCGIDHQKFQDFIHEQSETAPWAGGTFEVETRYVMSRDMAVKLARAQKEWMQKIRLAEEQEPVTQGIEAVCGEPYGVAE